MWRWQAHDLLPRTVEGMLTVIETVSEADPP